MNKIDPFCLLPSAFCHFYDGGFMVFRKIGLMAIAGIGLIASTSLVSAQMHRLNPPSVSSARPGMMQSGMMGMMGSMQVNSEFEYLSQMIPHHEEAIATAKILLQRSDRPEMKQFARQIIQVQGAEIQQMQTWLNQWYPNQRSDRTYTPMMRELGQLRGSDLDRIFLQDMIMHHMGAVMMSHQLLNRNLAHHQQVRPFAQTIADSQRAEIWQMQTWVANWFGDNGWMGCMGHR
jgi:uncharacterized protein (DUF305 family)